MLIINLYCIHCVAIINETDKFSSNCGNIVEKPIAVKQLKPSLYVTYAPDSKREPDYYHRYINFYYIIANKEMLVEAGFGDAEGDHYFPVKSCDPHEVDDIFDFVIEMLERMVPESYSQTAAEPINMPKYFNVKTEGGAARKYEYFTFNHGTRWNEKKNDYYFCKGERSRGGFLMYENYVVGDDISKKAFVKGYTKLLGRIEKRLARKAAKKTIIMHEKRGAKDGI